MDSFWKHLPRPIVGLSAMDGVTDAPMRDITKKYSNPDFMVTEFTSADGIVRGVTRLLRDFYFTPLQRPIVAQIFGTNPESFRQSAIICCFLGFDGIDINMGCPADTVAHRGGGAALIQNPTLAKQLVRAVQQGVREYTDGIELADIGLPSVFVTAIQKQGFVNARDTRESIPVSVKTRIGYDKVVTREWVSHLLEVEPVVITLHGRTLAQQYSGVADWDEIAKGATLMHMTKTLAFGNGDLTTAESIRSHIAASGVDGVWVGRAAMGNPWIFSQYHALVSGGEVREPTREERFAVALEHARMFEKLNSAVFRDDPLPFLNMRKHLGWYIKGFPNAGEMRAQLFQCNDADDVAQILGAWEEKLLA